jgi:chorismate mutase
MSPLKLKKLSNLRKKLDYVDNKLLKLLIKRTNLVKQVMSLKEHKNQIVDKKRIAQILKRIKKKSLKHKLDPNISRRVWKNMIWSYIEFERKNFKK